MELNRCSAFIIHPFTIHHSRSPCLRITRISGSLAAVLVAYWAYALMAVPWIAPPAAPQAPTGAPGNTGPGPDPDRACKSRRSSRCFGPMSGKWRVIRPLCSRATAPNSSFRNTTLPRAEAKSYSRLARSSSWSDGPIRESIVLQAPEAVLQFDHDLNLNQPREANLLGGQLVGKIVIRSDWKQPGPEDDLLIVTKNVQLNKQSISTPERVEFRWGPHYGSGQDMEIKLLPGRSGAGAMDAAGIASFELRHIERLHLELGPEAVKGIGPINRNGPEGAAHKLDQSPSPPVPPPSTPVDILCSGPFQFDVARRVATFHDNVRVLKANPVQEKGTGPICRNGPEGAAHKLDLSPFPTNPAGEPDQLACDLLSLWLIERPKNAAGSPATRSAKRAGSLDLIPERLEAVGNPVVVTAPSSNAAAHAKRIEYNLPTKSITLDGDEPVFLQQGANEIYARSLFYQSAAEEGRLGQLVAQGPGWLRGQSPERPGQQLEAVWRDQLRIEPRDQYKEISFTGGVELKSLGVGQLQAGKVFVWLSEVPLGDKKFDLQPHGLSASEQVRFNSSRLSGKLDELEVWFEQDANRSLAAASTPRPEGMGGMGGLPPIGSPVGTPSATASDGSEVRRLPETAQRHFEVVGRRLRARVLYGTADPALTDLTIEDNVQLLETQTSLPGKQPVLIRGNRLDVVKANAPDAVATIVGQPAHFEGDGLALTGSAIKVNCGTNLLTIDGPGRMDITTANDLEGKPLPAPCNLAVDWQRGMDFDGRTAHFEQSVVASTPGMFSKGEDDAVPLEHGCDGRSVAEDDSFFGGENARSAAGRSDSLRGGRRNGQPHLRRSATTRFARPNASDRPGNQPDWRRVDRRTRLDQHRARTAPPICCRASPTRPTMPRPSPTNSTACT